MICLITDRKSPGDSCGNAIVMQSSVYMIRLVLLCIERTGRDVLKFSLIPSPASPKLPNQKSKTLGTLYLGTFDMASFTNGESLQRMSSFDRLMSSLSASGSEDMGSAAEVVQVSVSKVFVRIWFKRC